MNFLPIFETRQGNNSGNLKNIHRINRTKFLEITQTKLNRPDMSLIKPTLNSQAKPPSGLKPRRYSLNKNSKQPSICDRSRRSDSSQDSLKENLFFIHKYELPGNKLHLPTRRKTQVAITKVFTMTQTDLSDEECGNKIE